MAAVASLRESRLSDGDLKLLWIGSVGGIEGDIGWLLENVAGPTLRPEATSERIGENRQAIMAQLIWIKRLMDRHGIIIVPSHDNDLLNRYREQGLLGDLE